MGADGWERATADEGVPGCLFLRLLVGWRQITWACFPAIDFGHELGLYDFYTCELLCNGFHFFSKVSWTNRTQRAWVYSQSWTNKTQYVRVYFLMTDQSGTVTAGIFS